MNPANLKYHKEHTWARIDGDRAVVGITDYAQESLGEVVYVEIPEVNTTVDAGSELGEIESTKATSSIISPMSGNVVEINEDLTESPEIVNEEPYGKGWIAVLAISDAGEADDLMDAEEYDRYTQEESQ